MVPARGADLGGAAGLWPPARNFTGGAAPGKIIDFLYSKKKIWSILIIFDMVSANLNFG